VQAIVAHTVQPLIAVATLRGDLILYDIKQQKIVGKADNLISEEQTFI